MTPERWRQIDDLFDAALRIDPSGRDGWLRVACGDDDDLRVEVRRLLAQDERADRDGFLDPPEAETRSLAPAANSPPRSGPEAPRVPVRDDLDQEEIEGPRGFSPRAAIAAEGKARPTAASPSSIRARLRELPIIHVLLLGMMLFWTHAVLGDDDPRILSGVVFTLPILGALVALLSSRYPLSTTRLKAIELGMTAMFAGLVTLIQYRLMLAYSLRKDPMLAQLTMKNVVLLDCILILTYGLYVPKSWRRAALVGVALSTLPFGTLLVLVLQDPQAMGWLWRGWNKSDTPRILLFSLDAMILLIVAAGSALGARTISHLRRQVVEARQLGQYHLRRRIGSGGMGEVYLAEHQLLKRPCALKLIRTAYVSDPVALERFEREVRITATLSHPNTVEIYDYGRTEDGTYYYVMEYLPGLSLEQLVRRHGPLPPGRVVYLLRQVCLALGEAHAAGLIHRDIKPSNIFAARRGGMDDVGKLLDFGLVRLSALGKPPRLSETGQIMGTPLFMSPEQATGHPGVDGRSDLYSLGAVAYYLLTGRPPFEGSGIEILIAHARDPVIPPSSLRAGIPPDLERVVLRCLSKEITDRYSDVTELERSLSECECSADWDQDTAARWWRDVGRGSEGGAALSGRSRLTG
jgi:tRNA A-37 threonylcarbamoyl transferase component Bud32